MKKTTEISPIPSDPNRAILVHLELTDVNHRESLPEFLELARSAGVTIVSLVKAKREKLDSQYCIGKGKAEEILQSLQAFQVPLVIFNHPLSPSQQRNLEKLWGARVLDRTALILDIFAQRARSFEGKLQVELAQLEHLSTRLVRGWTHLERQKGGIGLRGPGETQLETDRRLIRNRIMTIQKRLDKVKSQRAENRKARSRAKLPLISLVGYTNAGKTTLFNQLTLAKEYVADQLFATLDTTLRRKELQTLGTVVFADTVGFIHHLPPTLVAAFRATLEETKEAHLLLHVIDAADEASNIQKESVLEVLTELGSAHIPRLEVYNKIDLIEGAAPRIERDEHNHISRVWISSQKEQGLDFLQLAIIERLTKHLVKTTIQLPAKEGALRAALYRLGGVSKETVLENGDTLLSLCLSEKELTAVFRQLGSSWQPYVV